MLRVARRMISAVAVVGMGLPLSVLWERLFSKTSSRNRFRSWVYRMLRRSLGVKKVSVIGTPASGAVLFVANHVSSVDIPVLAGIVSSSFFAKASVRKWPVIGWVATQQGCVFTTRKRSDVVLDIQNVGNHLRQGKSIILFPEGTTDGEGSRVSAFKSSCFELPPDTIIQPVSLKYTHCDDLPANRCFQKTYRWREESFFAHMRCVLSFRRVGASVQFHPPFHANEPRKMLATRARDLVQKGVDSL